MKPRLIILDASVAIKWLLPDEQDDYAFQIKNDFADKKILIAVPLLFFYEIGNILKNASKSLRIASKDSIKVYQSFLELEFIVYSSKELFKESLQKSLDLDISCYDASYVVLAEYLEIAFYTADDRLITKANSKWVKRLTEYLEKK